RRDVSPAAGTGSGDHRGQRVAISVLRAAAETIQDRSPMTQDLHRLIATELQRAVAPGARAATDDIVRRLGKSVAAVLFYGSCLRTGDFEDKILDFYVLVDSYRS